MKIKIVFFAILLLDFSLSNAQNIIKGFVYEKNETKKQAIPSANVYWKKTTTGVTTNKDGEFEIVAPDSYPSYLIVSFIGYQSDTILLNSYQKKVTIELKNTVKLSEFKVQGKKASTFISTVDPLLVETISAKELTKAACCNISESFETNASVDVNFTDAATGSKKIQMLGLDGIYTQIQFENIPLIRGLSSAYGLTFIPGTWAQSIQVKKGAGSVLNGYESITGQINIEFLKPDEAEQLYLNVYGNAMGRAELNVHAAQQLNKKWSTMTFVHASNQSFSNDNNNDNFEDTPIKSHYNFLNRWKYFGEKYRFQAGVRGVYENLKAGQITANPNESLYAIGIKTKQLEVFTKSGFLFPNSSYKSIGILSSFRIHDHESFFGSKSYDARQISGYLNVIYQTILGQTDHKLKFGGSWVYDNYDKNLNESFKFGKVEYVPGIFVEYAYNPQKKTDLVLGLRADHHNTYGAFITPRAHYKYNFTERSAFRLSVGRGFRTANPVIENTSALANSRTINLARDLQPEIAWNYGSSVTHKFEVAEKNMGISIDYYFTDFENQVVVDMENPREISFYNLDGKSYSHSLQAEYNIEITHSLELKAAYKWYNIKTTFDGALKSKPLTPSNRVLVNISYFTNFDKWKFDLTANWFDLSRIPSTASNAVENIISTQSEQYYTFNGQVTRNFKHFEIYSGVENIFNYKQENPIIASNDPNGPNFDATLIWGPIIGRNIYVGLRYKIK